MKSTLTHITYVYCDKPVTKLLLCDPLQGPYIHENVGEDAVIILLTLPIK